MAEGSRGGEGGGLVTAGATAGRLMHPHPGAAVTTSYLSLATFSLSFSGSPPTISSTLTPPFMKWNVGIAETPAAW